MLDRPLAAQRRSTSSIILSVAIHGALAAALIAVRFSVDAVHPRRNSRVLLVPPAPAPPRPRIAMRGAPGASPRRVTPSGCGEPVGGAPTTGGARRTTQASRTPAEIL